MSNAHTSCAILLTGYTQCDIILDAFHFYVLNIDMKRLLTKIAPTPFH